MRQQSSRALFTSYEELDDIPSNPSSAATLGDVIARRFSRRSLLQGALATTAISSLLGGCDLLASGGHTAGLDFPEVAHGVDETHHVPAGYDADVLIRWGDPVTSGAPAFDPAKQSAAAQEGQFGYNNDYVAYFPLPYGSDNPRHGLLCINHEYTVEELMFPGIERQDKGRAFEDMTRDLAEIEMAAHGASIIEVRRERNGKWRVVAGSRFARRISARSTEMRLSGPTAGHSRLKTSADPSGTSVLGTLSNCAGGVTPWGTYLMAEENFHGYFMGDLEGHAEERNYARYGIPRTWYAWGRYHGRFDINREPNEANRFGWIVEVDPLDPGSVPVKRTALGRFKHEGAETIVNGDGRVVLYSGDDQRFDYLYRFVSDGRFDSTEPAANRQLLDRGVLSVAQFDDDGTLEWLPLVWGLGPLTPANGFDSQADVLIETRRAADLLGATPLDRPEDVQPNPITNKVYVSLTRNKKRKASQVEAVSPRAPNLFGHIVELSPPNGDHGATRFGWEILVQCGNPADPGVKATWNPATSPNGWFAGPDNAAVDHRGNLWIATDQGKGWLRTGTADGVWLLETAGALRGTGRMFFRGPVGAEICGPIFTPDDETLFVAVQHPAVSGAELYQDRGRGSTFADPATRWPDFDPAMPPRPSVVAITKSGGGALGIA